MKTTLLVSLLGVCIVGMGLAAEPLTPELKVKAEAALKQFSSWGTDAKVIAAVKSFNTNPSALAKSLTQAEWDKLSILSPEIKEFTKNEVATYLRTLKTEAVSELFVSGSNGKKVAFLSKSTSWNHTGNPKHDVPMSGKTWIGLPSTDASTGVVQLQISFPVLDGKTVIGSIVVGLQVSKL